MYCKHLFEARQPVVCGRGVAGVLGTTAGGLLAPGIVASQGTCQQVMGPGMHRMQRDSARRGSVLGGQLGADQLQPHRRDRQGCLLRRSRCRSSRPAHRGVVIHEGGIPGKQLGAAAAPGPRLAQTALTTEVAPAAFSICMLTLRTALDFKSAQTALTAEVAPAAFSIFMLTLRPALDCMSAQTALTTEVAPPAFSRSTLTLRLFPSSLRCM